MILPLTNTPRDYAWGSTTAISDILGHAPTGAPEAELWLGAHPASPAKIVTPSGPAGGQALDEWIASDPSRALAGAAKLPFLLKILAAAKPLSLQAHPSREQARAGFARENSAGVALTSPLRNYRDDEHKPELIVALSQEFVALSGFRPLAQSIHDLQAICDAAGGAGFAGQFVDDFRSRSTSGAAGALAWAVGYLLRGQETVEEITRDLTAAAGAPEALQVAPSTVATIRTLAREHPGDPGIVIGALLNRVILDRGEAMFLPAGNVHAYLEGVGVELMSSSDNVLRGGLTSKHIDVDELLRIADFEPLLEPRLAPIAVDSALEKFETPVDDFVLFHYESSHRTSVDELAPSRVAIRTAAIAMCVSGEVIVSGLAGAMTLAQGDACFITGDEEAVNLSGIGDLFLATSRG